MSARGDVIVGLLPLLATHARPSAGASTGSRPCCANTFGMEMHHPWCESVVELVRVCVCLHVQLIPIAGDVRV